MDLPGSYASSHVTGALKAVCALVPLVIASLGFLYTCVKSRKVEPIIQDHFTDWKDRGIEVEYQSPRVIGRRQKQKGQQNVQSPCMDWCRRMDVNNPDLKTKCIELYILFK